MDPVAWIYVVLREGRVMFFIGGISQGQKQLQFNQLVVCSQCGAYGRYQVFMTYMYFSFFFIPLFKWGRRYYVQMSCCQSIYELDAEVGKRIARGESLEIQPGQLTLVKSGKTQSEWNNTWGRKKSCGNCGYETTENFEYCPKCGQKLS